MFTGSAADNQPNFVTSDGENIPRLSDAEQSEIAAFVDATTQQEISQQQIQKIRCPQCQHLCRPGELACSECGLMFAEGHATHKFAAEPAEKATNANNWPIGKAFAEHTPILLEIDGKTVTLPLAECLII